VSLPPLKIQHLIPLNLLLIQPQPRVALLNSLLLRPVPQTLLAPLVLLVQLQLHLLPLIAQALPHLAPLLLNKPLLIKPQPVVLHLQALIQAQATLQPLQTSTGTILSSLSQVTKLSVLALALLTLLSSLRKVPKLQVTMIKLSQSIQTELLLLARRPTISSPLTVVVSELLFLPLLLTTLKERPINMP
jgi:hypothetical protein